MQISHILSDLTSLRLSGHEDALALLTAHVPTLTDSQSTQSVQRSSERPPTWSSQPASSTVTRSSALPSAPQNNPKSTSLTQSTKRRDAQNAAVSFPTLNRGFSIDREEDEDLKRAFDLMDLHRILKGSVAPGVGIGTKGATKSGSERGSEEHMIIVRERELGEGRRAVAAVVESLRGIV